MRKITILTIAVLLLVTSQAQINPQIRLKAGVNALFRSPGDRNYVFGQAPRTTSSFTLGAEYNHPFKSKKGAWHAGIYFQEAKRNYTTDNNMSLYSTPSKTVIYGGFEKYINRDYSKPSKNYFSVFAGVGLAFSLDKMKDLNYTAQNHFVTQGGQTVEGYTSTFSRPRFPLAPSVYGGVRYNITNRKGNEVFIIELAGGYSFSSYYNHTIDYTVDGIPRQDRFRQKGAVVQLNLIVPLHSFRKRR